jgi:DNA-binding HxlR family transcriptional regulator
MQVLGKDVKRYSTIAVALPHVTQKMLTQTLRKLERNGIIVRRIYPTVPPKVEYSLTPLGLDLLKLTDVVSEWITTYGSHIARAQKAYDRRAKL